MNTHENASHRYDLDYRHQVGVSDLLQPLAALLREEGDMNMSHNRLTAALIAAVRELVAVKYTANLRGYADREDLTQDALVILATGGADTAADAVRLAWNANREERVGGHQVHFSYFSQVAETDGDGNLLTVGEKLADTVADRSTERSAESVRAELVAAVAAVRHSHTVAAHGAELAARGAANGARGVANDAAILAELEAVGGAHYGYAAKVAANLRKRGIRTTANAVRVAVNRAKARTEGGAHSSRD